MTVTFQTERLADVWEEVQPLLARHWDEVATKDITGPLDVDEALYRAMGASGAVADVGGNLDLNLDTAEKGEIDALKLEQQGLDAEYGKRLEAWNYRAQGTAQQSAGQQYSSVAGGINPWAGAGTTLIGGLANVGGNYSSMTKGLGGAGKKPGKAKSL